MNETIAASTTAERDSAVPAAPLPAPALEPVPGPSVEVPPSPALDGVSASDASSPEVSSTDIAMPDASAPAPSSPASSSAGAPQAAAPAVLTPDPAETLPPREGEPGFQRDSFVAQGPFRHVLSLGTHCYTAELVQRMGWRRFAGPFDWIFSSPAMVRDCLEDDFTLFLDRDQLEMIPVEERPDPDHGRAHHRTYRARHGIDRIFNHHDVWTDEGYAYLTRTVERFRAAVAEGDVLAVQTRNDALWDAPAEFDATVEVLERRLPGVVLNAFSVVPQGAQGVLPVVRLWAQRGPHSLFRVESVGPWDPTSFPDPLDEAALAQTLRLHRYAVPEEPQAQPAAEPPPRKRGALARLRRWLSGH